MVRVKWRINSGELTGKYRLTYLLRHELEDVFNKYAVNHQYLTVVELAQFFRVEESEEIPAETLRHIIVVSEPCPALRERERLGFVGFCVMFTSARMNVRLPLCLSGPVFPQQINLPLI